MTKTSVIFLHHIIESINLIEYRLKNISYEKFIEDIDLQDMIIRRLEIIGEAVRNLPKDFRQKYPDINWQDPAEMRSMLIHAYFEVDLDIIWDTIANDLPSFKKRIEKLLKEIDTK